MSQHCPRCGQELDLFPLPVEPLYSMDTACLMIPMRRSTLKRSLSKHRERLSPPQYAGSWGKKYRLLTAADIIYLRSVTVGPHYLYRHSILAPKGGI